MRLRWLLIAITVIAVLLIAAVVVDRPPQRGEFCTVSVGQTQAQLDLEQGQWAALITAISQRRQLPPRAASIALATAFQESKVHNIDYGDRDSIGLFQQRPSQGWGTREEIMDPEFAIDRFYDALIEIGDYQNMEITDAAQRVQRSAYPGAYAAHENYARALASALSGNSQAAFSCQVKVGATGSIEAVSKDLESTFTDTHLTKIDDAHASTNEVRYEVSGTQSERRVRGWAVAQYAVANAKRLAIHQINFDGKKWSAKDSPDGWQPDDSGSTHLVRISVS